MKKVVILFSIIGMMILFPIRGNATEAEGRFVLFVMDGVDITELNELETPNLDYLSSIGAVGLMNTRTAGGLEATNTYLTLGAGERAKVGRAGFLNFNLIENYQGNNVEDLYLRRVGQLEADFEIANIEFARIIAENKSGDYQPQIGKLGTLLAEADAKVSVLGNADVLEQPRRHIALLGINEYGVINQGDVGPMMSLKSDQHPSGFITDQGYLLGEFEHYYQNSDLIIVESGDTSRIEAIDYLLTAEKYNQAKQEAVKRVDNLLGEIIDRVDLEKDHLFVVTPTPSKQGIRAGDRLTVTLGVGPRIESGLLTSGTTRRAGLVTNRDLASTIYNYLTEEKANLSGRVISSISSEDSIDYLARLNQMIKATFSWRPTLIKGFILLQIITLALAGSLILTKNNKFNLRAIVKYLIVSILWLPNLFLLSRFFILQQMLIVVIGWIILILALSYLLINQTSNHLKVILVPALVMTTLLIADLWSEGRLIRLSILGYSPVIGARFYGIGNEFMGVLIGASVIGLTTLKEIKPQLSNLVLLILFGLMILTVGHPQLGANFGGLVTAVIVYSITYFKLEGYNLDLKLALKTSLILIVIVGLIIVADLTGQLATRTHLAQAVLGGPRNLLLIIYRKLSMNLKLLSWTIWSKVLLSFILILILLFKKPQGMLRDLLGLYPNLTAGFSGLLIGSVISMLINDSGVVAAATLLLYPVFSLLYLVLGEIKLS
ncbi:hypothetical protein MWH28_12060 [Natroniella sulfidigena]|uniref:hypothetical protein n=1 Tax=Natroniella sulfidigena TaxID=723921 RepID=UPI00200AB3FF|nr:hypothetical protein [Natroniella sulfidigena]MCK8818093.1 hypothetical protein [Natroniella sulfidigena]